MRACVRESRCVCKRERKREGLSLDSRVESLIFYASHDT